MGIKDPTFRLLGELPTRSEAYEAYRREWERRRVDMDPSDHPVHVDIETVAVCDLRCGSSEDDPQGFDASTVDVALRVRAQKLPHLLTRCARKATSPTPLP